MTPKNISVALQTSTSWGPCELCRDPVPPYIVITQPEIVLCLCLTCARRLSGNMQRELERADNELRRKPVSYTRLRPDNVIDDGDEINL